MFSLPLHFSPIYVSREPPRAFSSGRGAPAGISLREPAAWLAQHSQFTPRGGFSFVTAPSGLRSADGTRTHDCAPTNASGAHSIKVLIELFQKFAGQGQSPCRSPQRAKLPSVLFREERGLEKVPLFKGATFSIPNSIREADTSLETFKRTCDHDMHSGIHIYMQNRHTKLTYKT